MDRKEKKTVGLIIVFLIMSLPVGLLIHVRSVFGVSAPILRGWGGMPIASSVENSTSPTLSRVFSGEHASLMEITIVNKILPTYNTLRVSFSGSCGEPVSVFPYSDVYLDRSIQIAKYYGIWLVIDFQGNNVLQVATNYQCWLDMWSRIVRNFGPKYTQIVWEPLSEPNVGLLTDLSAGYQRWINQARSLKDNHWIVVQNLCSYQCVTPLLSADADKLVNNYPNVTDTSNAILISVHPYMFYDEVLITGTSWNFTTADRVANNYYNAVVRGVAKTGWSAFNTEGGAIPVGNNPLNGTAVWPSDTVYNSTLYCACDPGSAGYSEVSFRFIQTLTSLFNSAKIGYTWWPVGDWSGSSLREPRYGALSCPDGWGCQLSLSQFPSSDSSLQSLVVSVVIVVGIGYLIFSGRIDSKFKHLKGFRKLFFW